MFLDLGYWFIGLERVNYERDGQSADRLTKINKFSIWRPRTRGWARGVGPVCKLRKDMCATSEFDSGLILRLNYVIYISKWRLECIFHDSFWAVNICRQSSAQFDSDFRVMYLSFLTTYGNSSETTRYVNKSSDWLQNFMNIHSDLPIGFYI